MSDPIEPPVEFTFWRVAGWLLAVVVWILLLPVNMIGAGFCLATGRKVRFFILTGVK